MDDHETFVREDGTYGEDDYIVTPQCFSKQYAHLFCIPTVPTEGNNPLSEYRHMWYPLPTNALRTTSDQSTRGISEAMVQIIDEHLEILHEAARYIKTVASHVVRIIEDKYRTVPEASASPINLLVDKLVNCLTSLSTLGATKSTTLYRYTEFRRAWLEITGWYYWYSGIRDCVLDTTLPTSAPIQPMMGAFVVGDPDIVNRLLRAGIPVWCIQGYGSFSQQRIHNIIQPHLSNVATAPERQPPTIIFKGDYVATEQRIMAIRQDYYKRSATPDMYEPPAKPSPYPISYLSPTQVIPRTRARAVPSKNYSWNYQCTNHTYAYNN